MVNPPQLPESKQSYRYWAFISYSSKDRKWAKWLHNALETYRLPAKLVKHLASEGKPAPPRLKPMFLDRAELQAHPDLGALIEQSLAASRYLIVICSPNSAKSPWVEKEIATFLKTHGPESVLSIIVGGEPNAQDDTNCFPPTLRVLEPKAPDARKLGDGRTNAKLMLLASMLAVQFATLKGRDFERKVYFALKLAALGLVALMLMTWLAWRAFVAEQGQKQAQQRADIEVGKTTTTVEEAVQKAWSNADLAFNQNEDPARGMAWLAEALRTSVRLPEGRAVAGLHRHAVLEFLTSDTVAPIPKTLLKHDHKVWAARYSPDGRLMLTISEDNRVRLWETSTGKPRGEAMQHADLVLNADFSADNKRIVTACKDKSARLWDAATGKQTGVDMQHESWIGTASFSPDSQRVLTASQDNTARLWDAASGRPLGSPMKHDFLVNGAKFSHDGSRVITISMDGEARIWDGLTGQPQGASLFHQGINNAEFSPDGLRFMTAGSDKTARLWDAKSRQAVGQPMTHDGPVLSASFSPEGLRIVTVSADGVARLWDGVSTSRVGSDLRHEGEVSSASFSQDGLRVVTGSADGTVRIWDAANGMALSAPFYAGGNVRAAFSPNGAQILTTQQDTTALIWNVSAGRNVGLPFRHQEYIQRAVFSHDGERIVGYADGNPLVWDVTAAQTLLRPLIRGGYESTAFVGADGRTLVWTYLDRTARIWNRDTGAPVGESMSHPGLVRVVSFSADGKTIVTQCDGSWVRAWDAQTGKPLGPSVQLEPEAINVVVRPDGLAVTPLGQSPLLHLIDLKTGKATGNGLQHEAVVTGARFSADGTCLVTISGSRTVKAWDLRSSLEMGPPLMQSANVLRAVFSPDAHQVVVTLSNGTAQVWDIATGKAVGKTMVQALQQDQLQIPVDLRFHLDSDGKKTATVSFGSPVTSPDYPRTGKPLLPRRLQTLESVSLTAMTDAAFSSDGMQVFCASMDKTVRIWHSLSGKPFSPPLRHPDSVNSVSLSPDGKMFITTAAKTVRIWDTVSSPLEARFDDLFMWAGYRVTAGGALERLTIEERMAWRDSVLMAQHGQDDEWRQMLTWKLSDPYQRTLIFRAQMSVNDHIKREISWALANRNDTLNDESKPAPAILAEAYDLNPAAPGIHEALAEVELNPVRKEFLRQFSDKLKADASQK